MPTVGSWCELDVICSAITALIQWTSPCVGFWLCTPPTGIVPINAVPKWEIKSNITENINDNNSYRIQAQTPKYSWIELFWRMWFFLSSFWYYFILFYLFNNWIVLHSRFTVDDADVVAIAVGLSSFPSCVEFPLCGCGLVIWLFPLFTELLLFVSVLLLLRPFKLVSVPLQGNVGADDFCSLKKKIKNKKLIRHNIDNWLS